MTLEHYMAGFAWDQGSNRLKNYDCEVASWWQAGSGSAVQFSDYFQFPNFGGWSGKQLYFVNSYSAPSSEASAWYQYSACFSGTNYLDGGAVASWDSGNSRWVSGMSGVWKETIHLLKDNAVCLDGMAPEKIRMTFDCQSGFRSTGLDFNFFAIHSGGISPQTTVEIAALSPGSDTAVEYTIPWSSWGLGPEAKFYALYIQNKYFDDQWGKMYLKKIEYYE